MSDDLLLRFRKEVLEKGPESTMPQNLPDEWLEIIGSVEIFNEEHLHEGDLSQLIMMAVLHILLTKYGDREHLQFSLDEMLGFISQYSIELALEMINRTEAMRFIKPTIETIFENREIVELSMHERHYQE